MKLNLGVGRYPLEGWKNIDIDSKCDANEHYDLFEGIKEEPNSVDEILISHLLMYLDKDGVLGLLRDCYRVLKPGGIVRVTEDNKQVKIRNTEQQKQYGNGVLFTMVEMEDNLSEAGFVQIRKETPFEETKQHLDLSTSYPLAGGLAAVYFISARKPGEKEPIVYLGLDDFGEKNSNLDLLWRLKDYFDDFRVNLFAIPTDNLRDQWLEYLDSLKWVRLCLHGYNHTNNEELEETILTTLTPRPFAKVYKAPFWELSDTMYKKLKELDFKILLYPTDGREGIKFNWDIETRPPAMDIIHGYGHVRPHDYLSPKGNPGSALPLYFKNILDLPKNTQFEFY